MEMNVIKQPLALRYESVFPDCDITITWDELRTAEQGHTWTTEDGDKYVNCECRADVRITVVFKNDYGCAVLTRVEWDDDDSETELKLEWYDFT